MSKELVQAMKDVAARKEHTASQLRIQNMQARLLAQLSGKEAPAPAGDVRAMGKKDLIDACKFEFNALLEVASVAQLQTFLDVMKEAQTISDPKPKTARMAVAFGCLIKRVF